MLVVRLKMKNLLPGLVILITIFCVGHCQEESANQTQTFTVWTDVSLSCEGNDTNHNLDRTLLWLTPSHSWIVVPNLGLNESSFNNGSCLEGSNNNQDQDRVIVSLNGSISVKEYGWRDKGIYRCYSVNKENEIVEKFVYVSVDSTYRWEIYHFSLIYGFATAGGFLLLALLFKLIYFLLFTYGCCLCCCCCENQLPPKAKKVKVALDSIEAYKQQQLDKLKDNYAQQSEWIRDNCAIQMERVRDNYKYQVQNIRDIRQYGSTQIQAVREQYFEQMHRIRDYSMGQMDRAHENYIFQRQRLRKFSAQNYLRMRATGKYTQRTLNKVMENLPPLYLDLSNCRQGMGGRQESVNFPAEFRIEELEPFDPDCFGTNDPDEEASMPCFRNIIGIEDQSSLYFTPDGTPMREPSQGNMTEKDIVKKKSSSLKNTPTRDTDPYRAVYQKHKKSKSFSNFLPQKWLSNKFEAAPAPKSNDKQQTVKVIVERSTTSADYLDVDDVCLEVKTDEKLKKNIDQGDNDKEKLSNNVRSLADV